MKKIYNLFNSILIVLFEVLTFISKIFLLFLLILHFSKSFSSFYQLLNVILTFFCSSEGSLGLITVLSLLKPILNHDHQKVKEILAVSKRQYLYLFFVNLIIITVIFGLININFYLLKNQIIIDNTKHQVLQIWKMGIIYYLFSLSFLIPYLVINVYINFLQAKQKNFLNFLINIITDLGLFGLILLLISKNNSYRWLKLSKTNLAISIFSIFLIANLVKIILLKIYIKLKYPHIDIKYHKNLNQRWVKKANYITIYYFGNALIFNIDLIISVILLNFNNTAFISLFLVLGWGFKRIGSSFISSFKEYYAAMTFKKGRIMWSNYQYFDRYALGIATIFFIFEFLTLPFMANFFFYDLFKHSTKTGLNFTLFNYVYHYYYFSLIVSLQSFFYLISQPAKTLLYSKNKFKNICNKFFVLGIICFLSSLLVGYLIKIFTENYILILVGYNIVLILFMFIFYLLMQYHVWTKLTYNSNLNYLIKNIFFIVPCLVFVYLLGFKFLFKINIYVLSDVTKNSLFWKNISVSLGIAVSYVFIAMLTLWPKWLWKIIKKMILKYLTWFKKNDKDKNDDIFLKNLDNIYIKYNFVQENKKQLKAIYVMQGTIRDNNIKDEKK